MPIDQITTTMRNFFACTVFCLFLIFLFACEFDTNPTSPTINTPSNEVVDKGPDIPGTPVSDREESPVSGESNPLVPSNAGKENPKVSRVGFYNVENLFDTKDEPRKDDNEFTPKGRNEWSNERYNRKLDLIAKVIDYMGEPGLMGLAEVENATVLKDLAKNKAFDNSDYGYVHQESPDNRGIDVALLYDKQEYDLIKSDYIRINFPRSIVSGYTTRDVLYANLKDKKGNYYHMFVNHWPSRRDGKEASEPKRTYVAAQVMKKVDEIRKKYDDANIILVGDFNDEPTDKSISQVLGAKGTTKNASAKELYNLSAQADRAGYGSYNYRGNWNMLDQMIVSGTLLDGKGAEVSKLQVFQRKFMLFKHPKNGYTPNRTYGGSRYYGGYSDHLPICAEIKR